MKIPVILQTGFLCLLAAIQAFANPTISAIPNQRTFPTLPTRPISFVLGDDQTSVTNVMLTGTSSNQTLVANSNIVFSGSGSNWTVAITPNGIKGTNLITIAAQDSLGSNTVATFQLIIVDFTDIGANLITLDDASIAWGDYDNDGLLDLLVTGQNAAVPYAGGGESAKIYHNNGDGTFTDIGANLTGVIGGQAVWGDYNNDGRLDVLLSGMNNVAVQYEDGTPIYGASLFWSIYRNDGSNTFTSIISPNLGGEDGGPITRWFGSAWGDYDNDGKLDAVWTGGFAGGLYRNNGNDNFTASTANISLGAPDSTLTWVDYNNDGNLDLAYTPGSFYTTVPAPPGVLYQNEGGGNFLTLTNILPTLSQGSVAWEDYNNDGIFDVAMVGNETNTVLAGNGQGGFTNLPVTLPGGGLSSVAWGDFDNDGLPDLVVTSSGGTRILHNNGDGTFTDMGISLPGAGNGGVAVGDFNNDGCLDIAITGGGVTKIFRNDGAMPGPVPNAPANLTFTLTTNQAIFAWSSVTSAIQSGGFTYNLRVGTTPGGIDVVSPMADPGTGIRRIPALGNAGLLTNHVVTQLKGGTYYWSAQAINHSYIGSAFAPEQSFTILAPSITTQPLSQTNLIGSTISFNVTDVGTAPISYQWYFDGKPLADGGTISGSATSTLTVSDVQNYSIGNYYLVIGNALNVVTSTVASLTVTNFAPAVRYVNVNNPTPAYPYLSWSTAATDIQDAIDAAFNGDEILVTNGVYQAGGRVVYGSLTNRVVINRAVTVESVNGPAVTVIQGYQQSNTITGDSAVRCIYMTNNAILVGFTLTDGATRRAGNGNQEDSGGGVWCESNGAVISNCVITANNALLQGGGAYQGTMVNCILSGNTVCSNFYGYGAGAFQSSLVNCMIIGNLNNAQQDAYGGGTYGALVTNCTIAFNSCHGNLAYGAGAYNGSAANCIISSNSCNGQTADGGGTYGSTVVNSAIVGNSCNWAAQFYTLNPAYGGGAYNGNVVNCTITGNYASTEGGGTYMANELNCINCLNICPNPNGLPTATNAYGGTAYYCCSTPKPSGVGNITGDPLLASVFHISTNSPCRGAGSAAYYSGLQISGTDIDGQPWATPPSIGCNEVYPGNVIGNMNVSITAALTNLTAGFPASFQANIYGPQSGSVWNFADGTTVTNEAYVSHTWATNGNYLVTLTAYNDEYPTGQTATIAVRLSVPNLYYVDLNCPSPVAPYSTWSTAAHNIQDAVDAAVPGSLVLVTNGNSYFLLGGGFPSNNIAVYQSGGRSIYGVSNRVAIYKPITVESMNGPRYTWISGVTSSGSAPIRGVYMTNGATLIGFMVTNCQAAGSGDQIKVQSGGGLWSESTNDVVTNCTVVGCRALYSGNGVYSGTFYNCLICTNPLPNGPPTQYGGGANASVLNNCTLSQNSAQNGGGAANSILNNCMISSNTGAGVYQCVLVNCTLNGNSGGGSISSTLNGCTLVGNTSTYGGGAYGGNLTNCILFGNSATEGGGAYNPPPYNPNYCVLTSCTLISNSASGFGGGAAFATLNNCTIISNAASGTTPGGGGGVKGGMLSNCLLAGNRSRQGGGGADGSSSMTLINCTLSGNVSSGLGGLGEGGVNGGNLINCTLIGNIATNGPGGASGCVLSNCTLINNISHAVIDGPAEGGGAAYSTLINCFVVSNSATGPANNPNYTTYGGGTYSCSLTNCLLAYNSSLTNGGGDAHSTLVNCTVVNNSAPTGGGLFNSTAENSIIYDNIGGNYSYTPVGHPYWLYYCCTTPAPNGPGIITNDPAFVNLGGGDFHLQPNSPCINSGDNVYVSVTNDLDGNPRIAGRTVDIGAYEYQTPSSILSYAWAQQYGLPTDGSADYLDLDGIGMPNWQKSLAGLNPTNSASALAMLPMTATNNSSGITVSWDSVNTRMYYLQRATDLTVQPPFSTIQSNLVGQAGTTSFTDTSATNSGPYFYRVGVQ